MASVNYYDFDVCCELVQLILHTFIYDPIRQYNKASQEKPVSNIFTPAPFLRVCVTSVDGIIQLPTDSGHTLTHLTHSLPDQLIQYQRGQQQMLRSAEHVRVPIVESMFVAFSQI